MSASAKQPQGELGKVNSSVDAHQQQPPLVCYIGGAVADMEGWPECRECLYHLTECSEQGAQQQGNTCWRNMHTVPFLVAAACSQVTKITHISWAARWLMQLVLERKEKRTSSLQKWMLFGKKKEGTRWWFTWTTPERGPAARKQCHGAAVLELVGQQLEIHRTEWDMM